jgi:hypothetical protein
LILFNLLCLTALSAIFQQYFNYIMATSFSQWWKKPEYPERTTDHGQATGNLYTNLPQSTGTKLFSLRPIIFGKFISETGEIGAWRQLMCS